jgi:hypothetical protein
MSGRLTAAFLFFALLGGCGARSGLSDLDLDAGTRPRGDGGPDDAGFDASGDAGPEPVACDGRPLPRPGPVTAIDALPRMEGLAVRIPDPEGILLVGGLVERDVFATEMAFVDLGSRRTISVPVIGDAADLPLGDGAAVHLPSTDQVLVVGGRTRAGLTDRTLRLTGMGDPSGMRVVNVQRLPPYPPGPAGSLVAVLDPMANRVVVRGGRGPGGAVYGATWALELDGRPGWREIARAADGPPAVPYAIGYDPTRHRAVEIAGDGPDVWALDLATDRWERLGELGFAPSTRGELVWDDGACGFHLLSARRTRCVLEHWVLALDGPAPAPVYRGDLELEPPHFIAQSFFAPGPSRLFVLAGQRCDLPRDGPVPNTVVHEVALRR